MLTRRQRCDSFLTIIAMMGIFDSIGASEGGALFLIVGEIFWKIRLSHNIFAYRIEDNRVSSIVELKIRSTYLQEILDLCVITSIRMVAYWIAVAKQTASVSVVSPMVKALFRKKFTSQCVWTLPEQPDVPTTPNIVVPLIDA